PDGAGRDVGAGGAGGRGARRARAGGAVGGDGIQGRQGAGALTPRFQRRGLGGGAGAPPPGAPLLGRPDPALHVLGVWRRELHLGTQRLQLVVGLAGDELQRLVLGLEVVQRGDLLGADQVEARLRLVRVCDGGGADLEVALRRRELLAGGG